MKSRVLSIIILASLVLALAGQNSAFAQAGAPVQPHVAVGAPGLSFRYVQTFGVTGEGWLADNSHIFRPNGLFIDNTNIILTTLPNLIRLYPTRAIL